jgi:hypothetical protein
MALLRHNLPRAIGEFCLRMVRLKCCKIRKLPYVYFLFVNSTACPRRSWIGALAWMGSSVLVLDSGFGNEDWISLIQSCCSCCILDPI